MYFQILLLAHFVMATLVFANSSMLGGTYCEILWGANSEFTVSWNGTGGLCPDNPGFFNVTAQDVKEVHGNDVNIIWNGMRAWTLDQFIPQQQAMENSSETSLFYEYGSMFPDGSGLLMRNQATLMLDPSTQGPYRANNVTRFQTALWKANTTVYELISTDCNEIYTMQSVFLGRPGTPGIEIEDLANLESTLSLPDGWIYRSRVLSEDLAIEGINGSTPVLQDNLRNSYSQMDSGFNPSICPLPVTSDASCLVCGSFAAAILVSIAMFCM